MCDETLRFVFISQLVHSIQLYKPQRQYYRGFMVVMYIP